MASLRLAAIRVELVVEQYSEPSGYAAQTWLGMACAKTRNCSSLSRRLTSGAKSLDRRPGAIGHVANEGELVRPPVAN